MEKESTSFWADIKKYEDNLAKDPKSYCFAPLSELYRKLGLIDDAISVAQRGTEVHPEYVGGYMALGRAYYEKGIRDKSKEALERVAKATPENLLAQKILFQIYNDEGNTPAAERALQLLVSFNPEDVESRLALEAMRRSSAFAEEHVSPTAVSAETVQETAICAPDKEEVFAGSICSTASGLPADKDYIEIVDSGEAFSIRDDVGEAGEGAVPSNVLPPSPLPTLTLAELYASQGFQRQALGVYEELLREDPGNAGLLERADSLRRCLEEDAKSSLHSPGEAGKVFTEMGGGSVSYDTGTQECPETEISREQMILETMEDWLNSIRRIRECR